jgi:hypothetical protein
MWTADEDAALIVMREAGKSKREIAMALGRPIFGVTYRASVLMSGEVTQ